MKTSQLNGTQLDRWVCLAEGWGWHEELEDWRDTHGNLQADENFTPSSDWAHGGPIIEREKISVIREDHDWRWLAAVDVELGPCERTAHPMYGETPLIAAMRTFVASKFGPDLPESA